jgi:hypothetical protein
LGASWTRLSLCVVPLATQASAGRIHQVSLARAGDAVANGVAGLAVEGAGVAKISDIVEEVVVAAGRAEGERNALSAARGTLGGRDYSALKVAVHGNAP